MFNHDERAIVERAIKNYQARSGLFDLNEFKEDFQRVKLFCKFLKQNKIKNNFNEDNIRLLLNYLVVIYNTFEGEALELLICYSDEAVIPELMAFLKVVNRYPNIDTIEVIDRKFKLGEYNINLDLLKQIQKELAA